jgi:hypothetical protein
MVRLIAARIQLQNTETVRIEGDKRPKRRTNTGNQMSKKKKAVAKKAKAAPRPGGNLKARAFGAAADEFGKEIIPLGPRAGAIALRVGNLLLGMMEGAVYGFEQVGDWLQDAVSKRLQDVPEDQIVQPDPRIAVPAVQALIYSMDDDLIREMFANLLAANMNQQTRGSAHPAFVEIIKEMTPLDAKSLQLFRNEKNQIHYRVRLASGSKWSEVANALSFEIEGSNVADLQSAINNLERLGLLERRMNEYPLLAGYADDNKDDTERGLEAQYAPLAINISQNAATLSLMGLTPPLSVQIAKTGIFTSPLGRSFLATCLKPAS